MSAIYTRGRSEMKANLTPMIDVTFLLIVFFVLVSQIVEVENVDLDPPVLTEPATELPGDEQRAVINVIPGVGGAAAGYRLGAQEYAARPAGVAALTDRLADLLKANPTLAVNLRADQRTHYKWVEPVLRAIGDAAERSGDEQAAPRVNLVIVREDVR